MRNEGKLDRVIRVAAGAALLSMAFVGPGSSWGYIGILPLLTGLTGFCPLYLPFGIDTRPAARRG